MTVKKINNENKKVSDKLLKEEINKAGYDFNLELLKRRSDAENKCVTEVLTTYLSREPKEEDFKMCTKILLDENDEFVYALAYKSTILGIVRTVYVTDTEKNKINIKLDKGNVVFKVEFDPNGIVINKDNTISHAPLS